MNKSKNLQHFQVLFEDDHFIAIHKPPGYVVHRSPMTRNAPLVVLQLLRDQIQKFIYPIHRLDRKTSGVLLFALTAEANRKMGEQFVNHRVEKMYEAIVRGWTPDKDLIDYNLQNERGVSQVAVTSYETVRRYEIDVPFGKFNTSRYSLVNLFPKTGRMHQLRKHMSHIFHPIVGDRPHGCNKQNRLWKQKFNMDSMMLHAKQLSFKHPYSGNQISIFSERTEEFSRVIEILTE